MSADGLDGRTALVTGAGSGIGRETALRLAEAGALVVAADIDGEAAAATAQAIGACGRPLALNVGDEAAWRDAVASLTEGDGRLDVLVNCAGVGRPAADIERCTLADWRAINRVNLDGVFFGCRAALGAMIAGGRGGAIVNVSSQLGLVATGPDPAYCAGKGAVAALTAALARHCLARGLAIRCNAIHPGFVNTAMTAGSYDGAGREEALALHPIGRLGEVGDIAPAIVYLAGERARFVTGASFIVDGGYTAQ